MIPLGGYVKFLGDENAGSMPDKDALERMDDAERRGAFHAKSVWRRALTVAAGPVANFILAIAIFAAESVGMTSRSSAARAALVPTSRPACSLSSQRTSSRSQ